MKPFPITQAQFDIMLGNPDWNITEIPQNLLASIPDLFRRPDVVAVYTSGDLTQTKVLNGIEAVLGMDVIALEPRPVPGEPELNIYHTVVRKLEQPIGDYRYVVHAGFRDDTIGGHWRGPDALDQYVNLPQLNYREFYIETGIDPRVVR
jgi:hypothetical protein